MRFIFWCSILFKAHTVCVFDQFVYCVKIVNPAKKKDSIVRDMRRFSGKFTSIVDLEVKLMEEFEDQIPPTTVFSWVL